MANFIQQFESGGVTYQLHDSEFIVDNREAGGAALTGVSKASALFDGMQITYWLAYAAGSNATLELTLAGGTTTGAIPCYYSGTTRLTTHYGAGNAVHLTYRENATIGTTTIAAGWWADANYYSDSNYDIFGTGLVDTAVYQYSLCAITGTSGSISKQTNTYGAGTYMKLNSFTWSGGTGTSKRASNKGFWPGKIFYHSSSSAVSTSGSATSTLGSSTSNLDLRYTVNGSTSSNIGVANAPFFLVGSINATDGLFYLKGGGTSSSGATKSWWQCGIPTDTTTTDVFWFVGMMSSKYQVRLADENWMLKFVNGVLTWFDPFKVALNAEHANSATNASYATSAGSAGSADAFANSDYLSDGDYKLNVGNGSVTWVADNPEVFNITATPISASAFSTTTLYSDFTAALAANQIIQVSVVGMATKGILTSRNGTYYSFNMSSESSAQIYVFEVSNVDDYLQFDVVHLGNTVSIDFPGDVPSSGDYILRSNGAAGSWVEYTDSDENVKQTNTTENASLRLLLSTSATDNTETGTVKKSASLFYNPSTTVLSAPAFSGGGSGITVTPTVTIANGDRIVLASSANSSALRASSITFGTATDTYLRNDGTWATPAGGGSSDHKVQQSPAQYPPSGRSRNFPILFRPYDAGSSTTNSYANFLTDHDSACEMYVELPFDVSAPTLHLTDLDITMSGENEFTTDGVITTTGDGYFSGSGAELTDLSAFPYNNTFAVGA